LSDGRGPLYGWRRVGARIDGEHQTAAVGNLACRPGRPVPPRRRIDVSHQRMHAARVQFLTEPYGRFVVFLDLGDLLVKPGHLKPVGGPTRIRCCSSRAASTNSRSAVAHQWPVSFWVVIAGFSYGERDVAGGGHRVQGSERRTTDSSLSKAVCEDGPLSTLYASLANPGHDRTAQRTPKRRQCAATMLGAVYGRRSRWATERLIGALRSIRSVR